MKARKLEHGQLSKALGSTVRGRVSVKPGFFGALQLADSVGRGVRPSRAPEVNGVTGRNRKASSNPCFRNGCIMVPEGGGPWRP